MKYILTSDWRRLLTSNSHKILNSIAWMSLPSLSVVFESSTNILSGTQTSADYIILSCYPTGYQTILFQPPESWQIEIPFLAKGENVFTVTAYNDTGQVTTEARTTYTPVIQYATETVKVTPFIMTAQGLIPMNPRATINGRVVPHEVRIGCKGATATLTGVSAVGNVGTIIGTPLSATAMITGVSAIGTVGDISGFGNIITPSPAITTLGQSGQYIWSSTYTAPVGKTINMVTVRYDYISGTGPWSNEIHGFMNASEIMTHDIGHTSPTEITIQCVAGVNRLQLSATAYGSWAIVSNFRILSLTLND